MSAPAPTPEAQRRYALIELENVALLLPQQDLRAIEPVLDVDTRAPVGRAAGEIRLRTGTWPVYCPSDDLEPLAQMLSARRICAMLEFEQGLFGLVCVNVASVMAAQVKRFPVPVCMPASCGVLRELGLYDSRIVCLTSAARLHAGFSDSGLDEANISSSSSDTTSFSITDASIIERDKHALTHV